MCLSPGPGRTTREEYAGVDLRKSAETRREPQIPVFTVCQGRGKMRRVLLSLAVTLALVMAPMQLAVLALGDIQVTLTCSDGTDIMDTTLMVDAAALTEL